LNPQVHQKQRLTANDFFTGLFSALKLRGESSFSIRDDRFDRVIKELYDEFDKRADDAGVELGFRIKPHPIYGESKTVRTALSAAAQNRIISFDNPEYLDVRIKLDEDEANRKLARLHVQPGLFEDLASDFLVLYRANR
jgi:hypothetical protein